MRGFVKWFDPEAGYGIIRSEIGVDVLVQRDEIAPGTAKLIAGQPVQFKMSFPDQGAEATIVRKPGGTGIPTSRPLLRGRVRFYDEALGRGIIRSEDGREIAVRRQAIQKPQPSLEEGEEVEFDWLYATQRIEAINVTVDDQAPAVDGAYLPHSDGGDAAVPGNGPGEKLQVFLCHASVDKPRVRQLAQQLRTLPVVPWLDEEQLLPGQDWQREIRNAIRSSHIVLACLSAGSVDKTGFVQREIAMALDLAEEQPEGSIFVIPLRFDECRVPERLQRWQWVDHWDVASFSRLTASLRAKAQALGLAWR